MASRIGIERTNATPGLAWHTAFFGTLAASMTWIGRIWNLLWCGCLWFSLRIGGQGITVAPLAHLGQGALARSFCDWMSLLRYACVPRQSKTRVHMGKGHLAGEQIMCVDLSAIDHSFAGMRARAAAG